MGSLDELQEKARQLLRAREARIEAGALDGRQWFLAILRDAEALLIRERAWAARTNDE